MVEPLGHKELAQQQKDEHHIEVWKVKRLIKKLQNSVGIALAETDRRLICDVALALRHLAAKVAQHRLQLHQAGLSSWTIL